MANKSSFQPIVTWQNSYAYSPHSSHQMFDRILNTTFQLLQIMSNFERLSCKPLTNISIVVKFPQHHINIISGQSPHTVSLLFYEIYSFYFKSSRPEMFPNSFFSQCILFLPPKNIRKPSGGKERVYWEQIGQLFLKKSQKLLIRTLMHVFFCNIAKFLEHL